MEKYITLQVPDGFEIPGILNWKEKSDKLIILVHGLTGSMTEAHYYAAQKYFVAKWYAVFRFNLYAGWEKKRQLHSSTIADHSRDIQTVLKYFEKEYTSLYLAGHSLGWPSIVWVEVFPENLEKIIFWDPAFDTWWTVLQCFEKNGMWFFYPKNGKNIEISRNMYDELVENTHISKLENIYFSIHNIYIIYASGARHKENKVLTDTMWIESCIIEWANHGFTQEWKYEELFEQTLEYLEK